MKTHFTGRLIIFFITFTLVSCRQTLPTPVVPLEAPAEPAQVDASFPPDAMTRWLNGSDCSLPCWEGIVPGKTSFEEAVMQLTGTEHVQVTYAEKGVIEWKVEKSYQGMAIADRESKTIVTIYVAFANEQEDLLPKAFAVYGDPSFVQTSFCSDSSCETALIYPDDGMTITILPAMQTGGYVDVTEHSEITGVAFYVPGLDNYKKHLGTRLDPVWEWKGYGLYDYEIDPGAP